MREKEEQQLFRFNTDHLWVCECLNYFSSCLSVMPDSFLYSLQVAFFFFFFKDKEAVTLNNNKEEKVSFFPLTKNKKSYSFAYTELKSEKNLNA